MRLEPNRALSIGDERISILEGVILPWGVPAGRWARKFLPPLAEKHGFDLNSPWGQLTDEQKAAVLEGDPELEWEGALELIRRQYHETDSDTVRRTLHEYMTARVCSGCEGGRLRVLATKGAFSIDPPTSAVEPIDAASIGE